MAQLDTLALARKHGLVETIYVSNPSKKEEEKKNNIPTYELSYLIVIDFESTCWDSKDNMRFPEIIEFPAVLLDLKKGTSLDEFHQYVTPLENMKLSDFCIKFTGISQEEVDNGVPLKTCLSLFRKWIDKVTEIYSINWDSNVNCALATWSDWDLGVCLKNECNRKHIQKPGIFNRWIDLRATYKECYERRPHGLKGALQELAIPFSGREHSGLWDARNTAALAYKMTQDGFHLRITKDIRKQTLIK